MIAQLRFRFAPVRFIVQLLSLLALNGLFLSILMPELGLKPLAIPIPALVSINSPTSMFYNVLDVAQLSLSEPVVPWLALGILFLIGAVLGRAFCGWVCPIGFLQDLITMVKGDLNMIAPRTHNQLRRIKYVLLAATFFVSGTLALSLYLGAGAQYRSALGIFAQGPFVQFSPDSIIFGTVPSLVLRARDGFAAFVASPPNINQIWSAILSVPSLLAFKILIIVGFVYAAYRVPRFWCRYLCPTGATLGVFQKYSFLGIKRDPVKCSKCPHCEVACPMQIKILDLPWEKFNDSECILCMECVDSCPHSSLSPKFP